MLDNLAVRVNDSDLELDSPSSPIYCTAMRKNYSPDIYMGGNSSLDEKVLALSPNAIQGMIDSPYNISIRKSNEDLRSGEKA